MTYCLAITVDQGLVFASDSRTNAGVDQVSTFSKMHRFPCGKQRHFTLLSAGNLATSQAVVRQLRRDLENRAPDSLASAEHLAEAAEYVGRISVAEQRKFRDQRDEKFNPEASFILGGQIQGKPPQIFLVYPEGNSIRATQQTPFLQIGEIKYGKPILDRLVRPALPLEDAGRCALVSMDAAMRSNLTVGPPVELALVPRDQFGGGRHLVFGEQDPYLRELHEAWNAALLDAFGHLPRIPSRPGISVAK